MCFQMRRYCVAFNKLLKKARTQLLFTFKTNNYNFPPYSIRYISLRLIKPIRDLVKTREPCCLQKWIVYSLLFAFFCLHT